MFKINDYACKKVTSNILFIFDGNKQTHLFSCLFTKFDKWPEEHLRRDKVEFTERKTANMPEKIIQLNEEIIKTELKELVRNSVEETLNNLLEQEAKDLTNAAKYERTESRQG